jgi:hypothetical protein
MQRKIHDNLNHAHFITFSCYRRRRLLADNRAKGIVIHFLSEQLKNQKRIVYWICRYAGSCACCGLV